MPELDAALRDQAEALCREGRFDQALPIYKSAVESFEQTINGNEQFKGSAGAHIDMLRAMSGLANLYKPKIRDMLHNEASAVTSARLEGSA